MAGFLQVGDFINFGRFVWQVYDFGWRNENAATKQYREFGQDVKNLAQNLDILSRVVAQANRSLVDQGVYNAAARWDPKSLEQIIGDYNSTLQECSRVLQDNRRYRLTSGALENLEWNILVQPNVERLRRRIVLHNSKVHHVLKPFEIDLLCSVRQDIQRVHQDLADRIEAVHVDLRRLIGVLTPDLEQALAQQRRRETHLLEVPLRIRDMFRRTALETRRQIGSDDEPDLEDLTDALVMHFGRSTVNFEAGLLIEEKIPPVDQYINLLKCIWLLQQCQECERLRAPAPGSHWPSYVDQLEQNISTQCERFEPKHELVAPIVDHLTPEMRDIWPEKQPLPLVDVVTKNEMMEEILDISLAVQTDKIHSKLQLLRRLGSDGKRFRVNVSGTEQSMSGKARSQVETIDFDVTSAVINPLYAIPSNIGGLDAVLHRDERMAKFSFKQPEDILRFQQAVTGFKAWKSYSQYNAMVSFVILGRSEPLVENACIQLWIPKQMEGKLITSKDAISEQTSPLQISPSRATSMSLPAGSSTVAPSRTATNHSAVPVWGGAGPLTASPQSNTGQFGDNPRASAPVFGSPPTMDSFTTPPRPQMSIPRRPVNSTPPFQISHSPPTQPQPVFSAPFTGSPPSNREFLSPSNTLHPSSTPGRSSNRNSSISSLHSRTFSMSSTTSAADASNPSSSGSDVHTVKVSIAGSTTEGTIHRQLPRPMLVLFTQSSSSGRLSFVTIPLDEDTSINPSRCKCGRSGREGTSCPVSSIERKEGKVDLEAHRFESAKSGDSDWNLNRLVLSRQGERDHSDALWRGVKRVSIMFRDRDERARFGGTPNQCRCNAQLEKKLHECIKMGHRGLFGEVQEWYRRQGNSYHEARYASQKQVVKGAPTAFGAQ